MIKAIIFDLDGTLYDEREFVISGFEAVSEYLSTKYNLNSDDIFKLLNDDFNRGIRGKNFDVLIEKIGLKNEKISDLINIYRTHQPKISLYPDAKKNLSKLTRRYKLGLITDGWRSAQENKISALNLGPYFNQILINDEHVKKHWKPSKVPFKTVLEKLEVEPSKGIYVGNDPLKDFIGAKKLGMHTVRVRRKGGQHSRLGVNKELEAEHTITDLLGLEKIIQKLDSVLN